MSSEIHSLLIAIPGDLHLTEANCANHQVAMQVVDELNAIIHPDLVQFIGDNVQNALSEEFQLFQNLCERLQAPFQVLAGDHDVCDDPRGTTYLQNVGSLYGSSTLNGYRLIRLNTVDADPLGFAAEQLDWLEHELAIAQRQREQIVIFQHHYPYQIWEAFAGPGIDRWKKLIAQTPITAIFTGHTHYGQIANNGELPIITTRSIGDPEGGAPGYTLAWLQQDDLAVTYRTMEDRGPVVMITHPREKLLAVNGSHLLKAHDELRVRIWSDQAIRRVHARIDGDILIELRESSAGCWGHEISSNDFAKGEHVVEVEAIDEAQKKTVRSQRFLVDSTGRYSACPMFEPVVSSTAFC